MEILVSNLDQIIIVIIIISGYSLSLPLELKEEEGNLFARWWADEVQYYVSKQVRASSRSSFCPNCPAAAAGHIKYTYNRHGSSARPSLLLLLLLPPAAAAGDCPRKFNGIIHAATVNCHPKTATTSRYPLSMHFIAQHQLQKCGNRECPKSRSLNV